MKFKSPALFTLSCFLLLYSCKPKQPATKTIDESSSFRTIPKSEKTNEKKDAHEDTLDYFDRNYIRQIDHIYKDNIQTVLLHQEFVPLSQALIPLNGGKRLQLSFDDFDADYKEYTFQIIHCNADWQPSELDQIDYLKGFANDFIQNYASSENTLQQYTHYSFVFPNDNFQLLRSGNYLIHIYHGDEMVISKRFMVVENKVSIYPDLKRPTLISAQNYKQELDVIIKHPNYQILDPYQALKIVLTQNNSWENSITGLQPSFVKNDELVYNYDEKNVFEGGNEYRSIDLKNLRYHPQTIKEVLFEKKDNKYHVYLLEDEKRSYKKYYTDADINGKFLIKKDVSQNSDIEADYVWVHFSLPYTVPESNGNIYIYGQLSDWQLKNDFKMAYNYEKKQYEKTLLLKQGFYNYIYNFSQDGQQKSEISVIEGTHFETENDYTVYVYHRDAGDNYDQLIGVKNLNSIKRKQ